MNKKKQCDVHADLPDGTYFILDDRVGVVCRIEKATPNGIIFTEFPTWRPGRRLFRYRTAIHEMTLLGNVALKAAILSAFHRSMYDLYANRASAPGERKLRGFVKLWGKPWLVEYLAVCSTFRVDVVKQEGGWDCQNAPIRYFTKVLTETAHRRHLAKKAKCPVIRATFEEVLSKARKPR